MSTYREALPAKVYVISWPEEQVVKIGRSNNPRARLHQFRAFIPTLRLEYETAMLTYASRIEHMTHNALADCLMWREVYKVTIEQAVNTINNQIAYWNSISK